MQASILYLQANDFIANSIKDKFDKEEIEFLTVSTAKEAFSVYDERVILLTLVDANIQDMRLADFLQKCKTINPSMYIDICLDVVDAATVSKLSMDDRIDKIFLPPWNIEELVDGVFDSVDSALLDSDFSRRKEEFENEERRLQETIERLKASLLRQQHSYSKIKPFFDSVVEAFCDFSSADNETKDFIKKACNMLLRFETTLTIKTSDFADSLRNIIDDILGDDNNNIKVGDIVSCFDEGVGRSRLVDICFSTWLIVSFESMLGSKGIINIDSRYVTSSRCEFALTFNDYSSPRNADKSGEISKYIFFIIDALSDFCEVENEENAKRFVIRVVV